MEFYSAIRKNELLIYAMIDISKKIVELKKSNFKSI